MTGEEALSLAEGLNPNFKRGASDIINKAWINRIATEFYDVAFNLDPKRYIKNVDISLVANQSDYTFADLSITDFESIDPRSRNLQSQGNRQKAYPFLDGYKLPTVGIDKGVLCGLFRFGVDGSLEYNYEYTGRGSNTEGFYLDSDNGGGEYTKIVLTPKSTNTGKLVFRYIPKIPIMENLSDEIFLPYPEKFQYFYAEYLSLLSGKNQTAEMGELSEYIFDRDSLIARFREEFKPRTSSVISL